MALEITHHEIERKPFEIIKKLVMEYRNPQGALALIKGNGLTKTDIRPLLMDILKEAEGDGFLMKRQFDIQTMRYLTLQEWLEEYFETF